MCAHVEVAGPCWSEGVCVPMSGVRPVMLVLGCAGGAGGVGLDFAGAVFVLRVC